MTIGIVSHHKGKSYPVHRGFPWFTHDSYLYLIRRTLSSSHGLLFYVWENCLSNRLGLVAEEKECKRMNPPVFMMHRKHGGGFGSYLKKRFCSLGPGISCQILTPRSRPATQLVLGWKMCTFKHINCFILRLLLQIAAVSNIVSKTGKMSLGKFLSLFFFSFFFPNYNGSSF